MNKPLTIAIIDFNAGNLYSVIQALTIVAPRATIKLADKPQTIAQADRIVFPGQGAMASCMQVLHERQLIDSLLDALRNKPCLTICLGLQILFDYSEEGQTKGLGLLSGQVKKFSASNRTHIKSADSNKIKTASSYNLITSKHSLLKIPHMGWNLVERQATNESNFHPLWQNISPAEYFYFAHSYYVQPNNSCHVSAIAHHGEPIVAAIAKNNIFAVQFHPEKSAQAGLTLFKNFVSWNI